MALNLHSPYAMMTFYLRTKKMLSSGTAKRGKKIRGEEKSKQTNVLHPGDFLITLNDPFAFIFISRFRPVSRRRSEACTQKLRIFLSLKG